MRRKIDLSACLLLCCLFACPRLFGADNVTGLANVVFIQDASLDAGAEAVLTAMIKNDIQAVGFQFDLCLPEGITLSGEPSSAITSGSVVNVNKHVMMAAQRKDGSCRVLCYSLQNSSLMSSNGSAATIKVKVNPILPTGSYPVVLKNVEITNADGLRVQRMEAVNTTITVNGKKLPGDLNLDGSVDVADIATVISIMASGNASIDADVNGDGTVDVADIATIISVMSGIKQADETDISLPPLGDMMEELSFRPMQTDVKRADEMLNPKH